MTSDPVLSRLGMARRAGRLSAGFAASKEACVKGTAVLVLIASDVSEKSEKEIRYFGGSAVTALRVPYTMEQISAAIGVKAGIVSVNDGGFSNALLKAIGPVPNASEQL